MTRKKLPITAIIACFLCLALYIVVNDINYRQESAYREIQLKTYRVYSDWHRFIGTLRGLILTTHGFGDTLNDAAALKARTENVIAELKQASAPLDKEVREPLESFIASIEAGLKLGQELMDNGYLFLKQPDLPSVYSEGRIGLSSLTGKDATAFMGPLSAYQYYQIVGRLKGMNVLFDQIFSDRLDNLLATVDEKSERIRLNFFVLRAIVLLISAAVISATVIRLYGLNRRLRTIAEKTSEELVSTRSHLTQVQDFLHSAQFQNSLFDMVAGLSHELNTPLGNCVSLSSLLESRLIEFRQRALGNGLTRNDFDSLIDEGVEGFSLIRTNLDQMKIQIDTFKRLSSVNEELSGASLLLSEFITELKTIIARSPQIRNFLVEHDRHSDIPVRFAELNQIFSQLVANTVEHSQADSIRVRFTVTEDTLEIEYSDNGLNLTPDTLARMAEPFFTTARGKSHMGLGLSIIASLISNKLQGHIEFEPADPGLKVIMRMPISSIS